MHVSITGTWSTKYKMLLCTKNAFSHMKNHCLILIIFYYVTAAHLFMGTNLEPLSPIVTNIIFPYGININKQKKRSMRINEMISFKGKYFYSKYNTSEGRVSEYSGFKSSW